MNGKNISKFAFHLLMVFSADPLLAFTSNQGKSLFENGKYAEAGEYFREKATSEPENSIHYFNQGLANLRMGDFETAESALSEALKLEIDNPVFQSEIYEALAITKFEHGRELSSSDINRTAELWKQSQLDFNSARNLAASNDSERRKSLKSQQTLVEERLKNLIYIDGVSKYKDKDYEGASASFDQAFQYSTPDEFDEIHYNQGNCKYRIGEIQLEANPSETVKTWENALENYDEAINLRKDSSFPQAERNKEILLKRLKQLKEQLEQQKQESQDQDNSQESEEKEKDSKEEEDNQSQSDQNQSQENKNSDSDEDSQQSNEQKESSSSQNENSENGKASEKSDKHNEEDAETGKSTDSGKKENSEEEANVVPGRMTREQAAQLLQQLKTYERKLPLGNLEHIRKKEKKDNREGRNW